MSKYDDMLNLSIILSIKNNDINKLVKEVNAIKNSKTDLNINTLQEYINKKQNEILYEYLDTNNFEGIEIFHYLKDEKFLDINKIKIENIGWKCENLIGYLKDMNIFNKDILNELISNKNYEKVYSKKFEILINHFEIDYNKVTPKDMAVFINTYIEAINMSDQFYSGISKRNEDINKIKNKILNNIPHNLASEMMNYLNDNEIKSYLSYNIIKLNTEDNHHKKMMKKI